MLDLKLSGSVFWLSMTLFACEVQSHRLNATCELTRMTGLAIDLNYLGLTDETRPLLSSEVSDDLVKDLDSLGSNNVMVEVEVGSNGVRLPLLVTDVAVVVVLSHSVSLLDSNKLLPDTEEVVVKAESADSDASTLVLVAMTLGDSVVPLDTTEMTNIEWILITSGSLDSDVSAVVPVAASVCVTDLSSQDLCNPDE